MNDNPSKTALNALLHPLSVSALTLILLNALVFQPLTPSWLTGKLADLAWMIVLPLALSLILALFWRGSDKSLFFVAAGVSAIALISLKALPATNILAKALFENVFGSPLKLIYDPTDLIALAGIPIAWWAWRQPWLRTRRIWRFAPLALLAMASLADAADPGFDQVDCLGVYQQSLVVFTPERSDYFGKSSRKTYLSTDNGETWTDLTTVKKDDSAVEDETGLPLLDLMAQCQAGDQEFTLNDSKDSTIQYLAISGKGVYRSADNGVTFVREQVVDEDVNFRDLVYAPDGQTIVIAAGYYGALLRQVDGTYHWVNPSGLSQGIDE